MVLHEEVEKGRDVHKSGAGNVLYKGSVIVVISAVGVTNAFKLELGLHQGSILGPFLFAMVMHRIKDEKNALGK